MSPKTANKRIATKSSGSAAASSQGAQGAQGSLESKDLAGRISRMLGKLKYIRDFSKKSSEDEKKDITHVQAL